MKKKFTTFQEKWLKALESGEYAQATGVLCDEGTGFCCLGVACEAAGMTAHESPLGDIIYGDETSVAPAYIVRLLHLHDSTASLAGAYNLKGSVALTSANDDGTTFSEIAAFCRAHPEAVFTNFAEADQ